MANDNKITNTHFKRWVVLFLSVFIMCVVLAIVGIYYPTADYTIDSPEKLINAINHSDETRQVRNYVFTKSFEIDVADLPTEKCFYGHLNGNGYTLTITSEEDRSMTSPIFSKIQKGASVERLGIELNTVLGEDDNTADISLLAKDNFGIVKDCSISIQNIFIGSKCQNAAALIINNFGEINSVCVNVNAVESSQSIDNWQCAFGAISTTNYATAKNAFIRVLFNDIDIFDRSYDNQSVGYVFSKIGNDVRRTDVDGIYLFGDSSFWHFSPDAARMASTEVIKGDKPNNSVISEFIRYNGGVSTAWSASLIDEHTGFPLLNK